MNWCPECATVLANEQVVDGCCWRHETTPVEQRALEQWFLRITRYADELLDDIEQARRRLARARPHDAAQLDRPSRKAPRSISPRRTERADPRLHDARRHHLRRDLRDPRARAPAGTSGCSTRLEGAGAKPMVDARARKDPGDIEKEGFFTGHYAVNPFSGEKVPIWVGNFVLMGYGTGAIMAVPAHDQRDFEFCTQVRDRRPSGDPPGGRRAGRSRRR